MQIRVDVNRDGHGHIGVYVYLMKGPMDDILLWPFHGDVVVELLNSREDNGHHSGVIELSSNVSNSACNRVTTGKRGREGLGYSQFIQHSSLEYNPSKNTQYLQDDCLLFRVKEVIVHSSEFSQKLPRWQDPQTVSPFLEFIITNFSKRKDLGTTYISSAFLTHSRGYKLRLEVKASKKNHYVITNENGYKMQLRVDADHDSHSHIGVYVYLMKGPMDDFLLWPFHGDVVVELLNWREDNGHHSRVIELSSNVSNSACSRVTTGERGSEGWGKSQFIQHSALEYNPSKNTQYLQDDCLLFRVKEVIVHSSEFSQKLPRWQDPQTVSPFLEFTITNFSKRKDLGTTYISSAFLTHSRGYKMRLEVKASKKNHCVVFAVYARLLKGDNDDHLQWPIELDIVVQLFNWRQNANHHYFAIHCNGPDSDVFIGRVIGEKATNCWGTYELILCSELNYNSTTNTEYLQNDCLRFMVKKVVVYSDH